MSGASEEPARASVNGHNNTHLHSLLHLTADLVTDVLDDGPSKHLVVPVKRDSQLGPASQCQHAMNGGGLLEEGVHALVEFRCPIKATRSEPNT